MMDVVFISEGSNSFGDQILTFMVSGKRVVITNQEGAWQSVAQVTRDLEVHP